MPRSASIVAYARRLTHKLRAALACIFYSFGMLLRRTCFTALLCVLPARYADATEWRVLKDHSAIMFEALQSGESFIGSFPEYDADITFDPNDLWGSHIRISIPVAAVKVDGTERQLAITNESWFDTATYATATFESSNIERDGEDFFGTQNDSTHYIAYGTLTIRGISRDVKIKFTATPRGRDLIAKGDFKLNRRDYFVGTGRWASNEWVAHSVNVSFSLLASPKKSLAKPE